MRRFETNLTEPAKSTWSGLWGKTKILAPFLWPKKDFLLQICVITCFLLLGAGRVVNLYVPIFSKLIGGGGMIVGLLGIIASLLERTELNTDKLQWLLKWMYVLDSLTPEGEKPATFRWDLILYYVLFKFLQGGGIGAMGVLNNIRSFLWIKVQQYTAREVEVKLLSHLHSLSLRWHLNRRTGQVLRIMDRGTSSINGLLNVILFNILPTLVDIVIAVSYFVIYFDVYFGLIVFVTMVFYLVITISVTEWRTKFQRKMNIADNKAKAKSVDSLLNFETVKYYGNEKYEVDSFKESLLDFQKAEFASSITQNILATLQNVAINGGLLIGSLLCVYKIVEVKDLTVGDYILFSSYIVQLYSPLNFFGFYYRTLQGNFVDMENLFDLFKEEQEVSDTPEATELSLKGGTVEFDNVSFAYTDQPILKNITFTAPSGKTVALVGPSGSGKSTIIRLLFKFYNIQSGSISIDEQNINKITQESLRKAVGVVPQDTVLFNNTIKYNIQYGRLTAEEAYVVEAARAADIHEKILTFKDEYETHVGERGLRLSGGEKQRVAIARTLLKAPQIVLLDEATSALDTQTERNIQESLNRMCSNRTTIIVAHRLSTIIHADEIIVLKDGIIVERGRHEYLVDHHGVYAAMWQQQLHSNNGNYIETT